MINRLGRALWFAIAGFALVVSSEVYATPFFLGLGGQESRATAVSADGSVVVGVNDFTEGFRWEGGTMVGLGNLQGASRSVPIAVSADGGILVGQSRFGSSFSDTEAFRWDAGTFVGLGHLSGDTRGSATGVSADGSVVVGQSGNEPFRWEGGTMTGLGHLSGDISASARGVSADGSVVVGRSASQAFRWEGGTMVGLGAPPGDLYSQAYAVSADGTVVVGRSTGGSLHAEAFRWEGGTMTGLGTLQGGVYSEASGVSGDGSAVVGTSRGLEEEAFYWDGKNGMRAVDEVLTDIGVGINGWRLLNAKAISADGSTIVGNGINPAGKNEAWIARIDGTGGDGQSPTPEPGPLGQTIYLNLGEGTVEDWGSTGFFHHDTFDVGGLSDLDLISPFVSDDSELLKTNIVAKVKATFLPYEAEIVTEQPQSGDFSTVFFGARNSMTTNWYNKLSILGVAETVDFRNNNDRNDQAVIFGPAITSCFTADCLSDEIADIVNHEIGHLLGLLHLEKSNLHIMGYDTGSAAALQVFSTGAPLATPYEGATQQNDRYGLYKAVGGDREGSFYGSPTDLDDWLERNEVNMNLSLLDSASIYNAEVYMSTGADDTLPTLLFEAPVVESEMLLNLGLGSFPGGRIFLVGSSEAGGEYDIFGTSEFLTSGFDQLSLIDLYLSGVPISSGTVKAELSLYQYSSIGSATFLGNASIQIENVSEPTTIMLLIVSLLGAGFARKRRTN